MRSISNFPNNYGGVKGRPDIYATDTCLILTVTVKYRYEISQHYHYTQKGMVMADKVKRTGQIHT